MPVDELQVAIKAVIRASEVILETFGNPTGIEYKSRVDVVTETDKKCEEEIVNILRSETPEYGIIGEEGANFPGEKVWIVDPLDGTTNFLHSYPFCGPSIGLCEGNTVLVGVLANPLSNELFFASKNPMLELTSPNPGFATSTEKLTSEMESSSSIFLRLFSISSIIA